jgi:hypothetical protein
MMAETSSTIDYSTEQSKTAAAQILGNYSQLVLFSASRRIPLRVARHLLLEVGHPHIAFNGTLRCLMLHLVYAAFTMPNATVARPGAISIENHEWKGT